MILNPYLLGGTTGSPTWDPSCLGAGLIGWYDGTDNTNMILSGSNVTQLNDLSGNANHMTVVASNAPEFSTDHINFDHSTVESLETAPGLSTDYGAYFLVANIDASTTDPSTIVGFDDSADDTNIANEIQPFRYSGARVRMWENGASLINLGALLTGTKRLFSAVVNSTSAYGRVNGATSATAVPGTKRFNFDEITIGRSYQDALASSMEFYELIVIKGDITTAQFESLEWYLADKHGLTLDASHTYFSTAPTSCDPVTTTPPSYDMANAWKIFFSAHNDAQASFVTQTGNDGNDYFIQGPDQIANVGNNVNGHIGNTNPALNTGFYTVTNGLYMNTDEKASIKFQMNDGSTTNGFSHGAGNYTMFVVYTWDGNTNDSSYKKWAGGPKGFKIEGASSGVNIRDNFNTAANGSGTASGGETFEFDPSGSYSINTGNPFFICIQRDVANNKYIMYTGELTGSATLADLKVSDTVVNAGWYLVSPFSNTDNEIEFMVDEDSILHAWGYADEANLESDIENTYLYMDQLFG